MIGSVLFKQHQQFQFSYQSNDLELKNLISKIS